MQPKQNEHVKECIVCSHLTPNTLDVLARTGQRRESNAKTAKSSWGSWRNSMEVSKEPWDGQLIVPSPILSPANEELELDQRFSVFFSTQQTQEIQPRTLKQWIITMVILAEYQYYSQHFLYMGKRIQEVKRCSESVNSTPWGLSTPS